MTDAEILDAIVELHPTAIITVFEGQVIIEFDSGQKDWSTFDTSNEETERDLRIVKS